MHSYTPANTHSNRHRHTYMYPHKQNTHHRHALAQYMVYQQRIAWRGGRPSNSSRTSLQLSGARVLRSDSVCGRVGACLCVGGDTCVAQEIMGGRAVKREIATVGEEECGGRGSSTLSSTNQHQFGAAKVMPRGIRQIGRASCRERVSSPV